MNSSKRGAVYGFKLQSLDLVRDIQTLCCLHTANSSSASQTLHTYENTYDMQLCACLFLLQLLETKTTDRKLTLLHYIANVVREKYPTVALFYNELHYVEKAAAGECVCSCETLNVITVIQGVDKTPREHTSPTKSFDIVCVCVLCSISGECGV